ncbi:hypothetical protein BDP27DRAFT_1361289 [Rhodocollybia butyracea]|uniref:Uncharacterized protein n=1 Tax=Rhodocollybia butyracea TaxID=206335 RepID=A0A9P5Q0W3_9AGAR|nr:hypothetical protein BDP27DRAFT_1361289 [Rhodocollybia butyracea]
MDFGEDWFPVEAHEKLKASDMEQLRHMGFDTSQKWMWDGQLSAIERNGSWWVLGLDAWKEGATPDGNDGETMEGTTDASKQMNEGKEGISYLVPLRTPGFLVP